MNKTYKAQDISWNMTFIARVFSVILAGLIWAAPLKAQEDDEVPEGDIYQLSPFTVDVSEDVGYRSTNTTSGTSLNTAIKDIPMSIEVLPSVSRAAICVRRVSESWLTGMISRHSSVWQTQLSGE